MSPIASGPHAYRHAPETSHAAASSVAPDLTERQLAALRAIRERPRSADEVARALRITVLAARPRVSELRDAGLISDTGVRAVNASGRRAVVWYCTALGLDLLESHR